MTKIKLGFIESGQRGLGVIFEEDQSRLKPVAPVLAKFLMP